MLTAEPLITACIRGRVHYLDIAAELDSYKFAEKNDREAKDAHVMLMPGCGGSVVMLGCLAGMVIERVKNPLSIDVFLYVAGSISRGSAISASKNLTVECIQRVNGNLVKSKVTNVIELDFGNGQGSVTNYPVTLPDVITIWKSTKIQNIRTFVHSNSDTFPTREFTSLSDGPTEEQREATPYHAAVNVTAEDKTVSSALLHTVNGYTFTGLASAEAARKVLAGIAQPGFQTPALVFGNDFVKSIGNSRSIIL
jgi:short subunit dehydrogenase-like uncharacterized protein